MSHHETTPTSLQGRIKTASRPVKGAQASRVQNGTSLLPGWDGRTAIARRYREILTGLFAQLGSNPPEWRVQLARRAASIACHCEMIEAAMTRGEHVDATGLATLTNTLSRLLNDLNVEQSQPAPIDLDAYLRVPA